jgi:Integrase
MKDLEHDVVTACRRHKSGGRCTQAQRLRNLLQLMGWLVDHHPNLRAMNLQKRHVDFLVNQIRLGVSQKTYKPLGTGRQKNLLSSLRWFLETLGKTGLLPADNEALQIPKRDYKTQVSKAAFVSDAVIAEIAIHCKFAATSVLLTREFGLRIAESLKFTPAEADHGFYLAMKASWCKGGVPRVIPIRTQSQRDALNEAHAVAGDNALIPRGKSFIQHLRHIRRVCIDFGVSKFHGARHHYAQQRYLELAGFPCPVNGGPRLTDMTDEQCLMDRRARETLSLELGHRRRVVTSSYLGSARATTEPLPIDAIDEVDASPTLFP